ncbi:MAG: hypothetical protein IT564_05900 [Rhodospirillales bacterium]|nr:hypothetical protein [Rhodospirillales bacterium]
MKSRIVTSRWTKYLQHAACGGALGLVVLAAVVPSSARAEEDDATSNSILNLERKIWGGAMKALGLRSGNEAQIDYRERSPLVVPPTRDLPAPETTGSVAVRQNPAWPDDPDLKRKREASKKKLDSRGYDPDVESRPLSPSELNPPGSRTNRRSGPGNNPNGDPNGDTLEPSALGYFGGLFTLKGFGFGVQKDEVGTFTREPPRTSLTAPPGGYQTPSAAYPYGVGKDALRERVDPNYDPAVGNIGN